MAVHFCHRNRIIHRDLKLENILLHMEDGVAHLGDFGSAVLEDDEFDVDGSVSSGSEAYAAPEILGGDATEHRSSLRTDIWSLGILLYGMLTGNAPWQVANADRDDTFAYYLRHGGAFLFEHRSDISDEAQHLVLGMLAVNPEERLCITDVVAFQWVMRHAGRVPSKSTPPRARKAKEPRLQSAAAPGAICTSPISIIPCSYNDENRNKRHYHYFGAASV